MYGGTKTLGTIMTNITLSYNTKPFTFEEMLRYFRYRNIRPELHLRYFMQDYMRLESARWLLGDTIKPSITNGGWHNFTGDKIDPLAYQLAITRQLGAQSIRLFLSPMFRNEMSTKQYDNMVNNIKELAYLFPDINLLFETHRGIGVETDSLVELFAQGLPTNVGLVFDPVNVYQSTSDATMHGMLDAVWAHVKHVHLKGCKPDGTLCVFGEGIDMTGIVTRCFAFTESFGIEYEGEGSAIKGLEKSHANFKAVCDINGVNIR